MRKWILPGMAIATALIGGGAAMAQPYGGYYNRPAYNYTYNYGRGYYRDSDRDGVPDRVEWGRDRDHDGRPDQWDRYDDRRGQYRREAWCRDHAPAPYYGYGYRY